MSASFPGRDELLAELKGLAAQPTSGSRISAIAKVAGKHEGMYKHVVAEVERFARKCPSKAKLGAVYVIDSIIRAAAARKRPQYAERFARNLRTTLQQIGKCSSEHVDKVKRVLALWREASLFPDDVLLPAMRDVYTAFGDSFDEDAGAADAAVVLPEAANAQQQATLSALQSLTEEQKRVLLANKALLSSMMGLAASQGTPKPGTRSDPRTGGSGSGSRDAGDPLAFDYGDSEEDEEAHLEELKRRRAEEERQVNAMREQENATAFGSLGVGAKSGVAVDAREDEPRNLELPAELPPSPRAMHPLPPAPLAVPAPGVQEAAPAAESSLVLVHCTTLWLGQMEPDVTEQDIRDAFGAFGNLVRVDYHGSKGMAFICFETRAAAEAAKSALFRSPLGGSGRLISRLGWARNLNAKYHFDMNGMAMVAASDLDDALRQHRCVVAESEDSHQAGRQMMPRQQQQQQQPYQPHDHAMHRQPPIPPPPAAQQHQGYPPIPPPPMPYPPMQLDASDDHLLSGSKRGRDAPDEDPRSWKSQRPG